MPCNHCFLAGTKCDEGKVFDHQQKCGLDKYDGDIDLTLEPGANFTNATFHDSSL